VNIRFFGNFGLLALFCFLLGMGGALFLLFRDSSSVEAKNAKTAEDPEFAAALCAQSRDLAKKENFSMAIRVAEKSVSLDDTLSGCQQYLDDLRAAERVFSR